MPRFHPVLAAVLAIIALATPATAAQTSAVTAVSVVKPVALSKVQDMDFGTLTFSGFTGTRTIVLSRAGAITCAADIVCSGTAKPARFNVTGSKQNTILITYSGGTLSNGTDSIPFTVDGQTTLALTNNGSPGTTFDVGGSLSVSPTLVGGIYNGTLTVTANYQ